MLRSVRDAELSGKRVFVRVDLNAPIEKGKVADDRRITAAIPTLKYILDSGASSVTVATSFSDPTTPLAPVKERLRDLIDDSRIVLRNNLREDPREEQNVISYAEELSADHDVYVNDAFGVCHRDHASVTGVPRILPAFAGFSVGREVDELSYLLNEPKKPFVVLIGGKKFKDKREVVARLSKVASKILLGGKTGLGYEAVLQGSENIILPMDDIDGQDIGPRTLEAFKEALKTAETVFWNGNMGRSEDSRYATGTFEIARYLARSSARVYVGGGNTGKVISDLELESKMYFVSTGGGATLQFIANGGRLPGLIPLER